MARDRMVNRRRRATRDDGESSVDFIITLPIVQSLHIKRTEGCVFAVTFGQVLDQVIRERNETQESPARIAHCSSSLISKITRGTRKPPKDVMSRTAAHYDDPKLCLAAMEEVTGGACTPWLNNADLHKSNVHLKTIEEVREAYEALSVAPITKRQDQLNEKDRQAIKNAIMESIEAITALTHHVAVLCKEYMFSWSAVWKTHRQELKIKKYLN
jgi:hypothetical protein